LLGHCDPSVVPDRPGCYLTRGHPPACEFGLIDGRAAAAAIAAEPALTLIAMAGVLLVLRPSTPRSGPRFSADRYAEYRELIERADPILAELEREASRGKFTVAEVEEIESGLAKLRTWQPPRTSGRIVPTRFPDGVEAALKLQGALEEGKVLRQPAGTASGARPVDGGLGSVAASTNRKVGLAAGSLVPPGVVTVTATAPEPAGVTAVILESLSTLKLVAWTVPKLIPVAPVNSLPLMVTWLPPASGPKLGSREVTTGRAANLNRFPDAAALVPAGVVTVTSTVPAFSAGEVAVICVLLSTVNDVAATLPKFTAVAPLKAVPAMVTEVPPAVGPTLGLTEVTAGGTA
jgi:hypothetical protein